MLDPVTGRPTVLGANYFRYNRDEYYVEFPVRVARPIDRHRDRRGMELWTFDTDAQNNDAYASRDMVDSSSNLIRHKPLEEDPDYTVAAIRATGIYATDTARRNEVIEAAKQTIRKRALKTCEPIASI